MGLMTTIKRISKFEEIDIIPNSFVILDIDETLIKFDGIDIKWWKSKFNRFYKQTRDCDLSDKLAFMEWVNIIDKCEPELVDEQIYMFLDQVKKAGCKIILLTARSQNMDTITKSHLEKVGLNFLPIHYNENKGQ